MISTKKDSREIIPLQMKFDKVMVAGEVLQDSCDVKISDETEEDVSSEMVLDVTHMNDSVTVRVKDGEDGKDYLVLFYGITLTSTYIEPMKLKIRDSKLIVPE